MQDILAGLQEALDNYRALQGAHGQYLDAGAVAEVARLAFERAQAFAELQNVLTAVVRAQSHSALPQAYREQLADILALEERWASRLQEQRDVVGSHLAQLRQSKKALRGYGGMLFLSPPVYVKASV
jgi:uncharacterized membrane protein